MSEMLPDTLMRNAVLHGYQENMRSSFNPFDPSEDYREDMAAFAEQIVAISENSGDPQSYLNRVLHSLNHEEFLDEIRENLDDGSTPIEEEALANSVGYLSLLVQNELASPQPTTPSAAPEFTPQ